MNELNIPKYIKAIENLPDKKLFTCSDLLINDFLIESDDNLSIFYAPFDYINRNAKIIIVGITPGFTQMEIAIRNAKNNLLLGKSFNNITKHIKENAAFAGQMRNNMITMFDGLGLNNFFDLKSCSSLFDKEYSELTHMTSIIRYPVFKNGKDYTGHSPEILKSNMLKEYIQNIFLDELNCIKYSIIIPLGSAVSKVLKRISEDQYNLTDKCLFDFPHPSGANGHRIKIFNQKKNEYRKKIRKILN
jgi:hypothetical protein